ncbi:hypothetical protein C2W62_00645 [Candidatus Entotheonella serta]|nr:hypothetical protein C2W62_00645 [Candidatus Entotheonella serta]
MRTYLGAFILLAVIVVVGLWQWQRTQQPALITLTGRVGGEKIGFLQDPAVQSVLRKRYGIVLNVQRYGSVEMMTDNSTGQHFLWPASDVNLEYYRDRDGPLAQSHNMFHSPIVLYSWDIVVETLVQSGVAEKRGESYYISDFPALIDMVETRKSWADLGLPQLYGAVKIISTDPAKSNSGNSFAGLLSNLLNQGDTLSTASDALIDQVAAIFQRMGFLEHSSSVLWDKFISQGTGAYPLIVGYENQLIEYRVDNPEVLDLLRQKVRILYPLPTVWSSHPLMALDENGKRLIEALQDPGLQQLAWERHGFRSGLMGAQNDPQVH